MIKKNALIVSENLFTAQMMKFYLKEDGVFSKTNTLVVNENNESLSLDILENDDTGLIKNIFNYVVWEIECLSPKMLKEIKNIHDKAEVNILIYGELLEPDLKYFELIGFDYFFSRDGDIFDFFSSLK